METRVTGCEDKDLNLGIAIGNYGDLFGLEEEFAYAKDFYGDVAAYESSVVTLMTNVLLTVDVGRIKPYGLVGIGLIKSNVQFGQLDQLTSNLNTIAWDLGGGISAQDFLLIGPIDRTNGQYQYLIPIPIVPRQ